MVSAACVVSRSRISPTSTTSGSCRMAYLRAAAKLLVSVPTSRWLTMQLWWRWMNSIGSSTVIMWPFSSLLILSTMAARVVLFPDPVGPVTSTRPRGRSASLATTTGRPRSSKVRTLKGIWRMTSDTQPRCLKQLPRKRARFWIPNEKSSSFSVSKRFFWLSVSTESASDSVSLGVSTSSVVAFVMSPSTRSLGRSPATMCRSEASFSIISSSSARRFTGIDQSPSSSSGFFDHFIERRDALLDLHHAVHAERQHALRHGELAQLLRGGTLENPAPHRRRQRHHLVQTLPSLVARAGTGVAALPLEEGSQLLVDPKGVHLFGGVLVLFMAILADTPHQPLRHDQIDGAGDVERLDAHVHHTGDGGRRVVGVQGREHQVTCERRLDRDRARLEVADLAHHDDVRVLAQERLQRRRERHPYLVADQHLIDAHQVVLDRVLGRHDVHVDGVDPRQRRVQGGGLAGARGAR